jgi:hypothetical protein
MSNADKLTLFEVDCPENSHSKGLVVQENKLIINNM